MKKLLIALAILPSFALAEVVATMPNQAGGKIVVTDEVCRIDGKTYDHLRRAYNYGTDGQTNDGCWTLEDETVVIVWKLANGNASTRRYPVENFNVRKKSGQRL